MGLCSVHDELLHELDVGLGDLLRVGQNLGHQNWHTNLETKRNTSFLKPSEAWNNQKQNIDLTGFRIRIRMFLPCPDPDPDKFADPDPDPDPGKKVRK